MKNLLILITIFLSIGSMNLKAEVESEMIDDEILSVLSNSGQFISFGEISGIGGKIAMNKVDSFVTIKNEIIPLAQAKVLIPAGKTQTVDNVLSVHHGDRTLKRDELLGVILK
ncbi:MAG: hypothetical protein ACOYL6_13380 [Bacteriovoracaceae bacterium]